MKPNFRAGDHDGRDLLESLRTGHSSHCGWTNNFCSEELLTFPARSSEIINEEFLLRLRCILLSITEFARDTCETTADQQIVEDIQSSPNNEEAKSYSSLVQKLRSSRMQVLLGADVLNSASDLASWLLRDQSGNVLEFPLLAASSPSCRSRIAATVEIISALLSKCTGNNTILTAGDASGILSAILSPNIANTSNEIGVLGQENRILEDDVTARQAVNMSIFLAICGWNTVYSAGASADSSVRTNTATTTSPSPAAVSASAVASSSSCSFRCEWCGRSFPLSYFLSSPTDPLFQHRAFCLWAHSSGITGVDTQLNALPGWQQCASSVFGCTSIQPCELQSVLHDSCSSSSSRRVSASGDGDADHAPGSNSKRIARKDGLYGDAEQAYKKIKSVMDSAALPRLSLNGRLST